MTYNKPVNLSYTDMAIWIDENCYNDNCDENTLYEYLYHLVVMLARKYNYFTAAHELDDFGLYFASRLFMRILKSRNPENNLVKLKSILNYIKKVIYPTKVDFDKMYLYENVEQIEVLDAPENSLSDCLVDNSDIFNKIDFTLSIKNVSKTIREYLTKIPYKKNTSEWQNIYISCLLTLMNIITVSKDQYSEFKLCRDYVNLSYVDKAYRKAMEEEPILYHLDLTYAPYIKVLVNELRHVIAKNLRYQTTYKLSSEDAIKHVLISRFEENSSEHD